MDYSRLRDCENFAALLNTLFKNYRIIFGVAVCGGLRLRNTLHVPLATADTRVTATTTATAGQQQEPVLAAAAGQDRSMAILSQLWPRDT